MALRGPLAHGEVRGLDGASAREIAAAVVGDLEALAGLERAVVSVERGRVVVEVRPESVELHQVVEAVEAQRV